MAFLYGYESYDDSLPYEKDSSFEFFDSSRIRRVTYDNKLDFWEEELKRMWAKDGEFLDT